jgi:hypothetical protein
MRRWSETGSKLKLAAIDLNRQLKFVSISIHTFLPSNSVIQSNNNAPRTLTYLCNCKW